MHGVLVTYTLTIFENVTNVTKYELNDKTFKILLYFDFLQIFYSSMNSNYIYIDR